MISLLGRLVTIALLTLTALTARAATNGVFNLDITAQRAAVNPVTKEVAFVRDNLVIVGYDVDARKTNWVLQPQRGNPSFAAYSTDGAHLFISMPGSNGVWQVNAATREPIRFILAGRVTSIMPIPGQPESFVSFTGIGSNPGLIAVWDAGVRRNATISNAVYPTFYDNTVYYQTNLNLASAKIVATGLAVENTVRANSFNSSMYATEKWLIDSRGILFDRANLVAMGRLPFSAAPASLLAFEEGDRLLCTYVSTNTQIHTFRLSNLQFTGAFRVANTALGNYPFEFVKLDANRAVFIGSRPAVIEPMALAPKRADLGLSAVVAPEPVPILQEFAITITVTNHGPHTATAVKLTNQIGGSTRLSVTATQGAVVNTESRTIVELGDIPAGGSARVTINARADVPSYPVISSTVNATEPDPDSTDDTLLRNIRTFGPTAEAMERIFPIDAVGLDALDHSKKLYATTDALAGKLGNAVLRINPITGVVEQTNVVGVPLGIIAVSSDEQFAYVSAAGWSNIARVNLTSGSIDWMFLGRAVREIQRIPTDNKIAVTTGTSVQLFDGLSPLPNRATSSGAATAVGPGLVFTGDRLYSVDMNGFNFVRSFANSNDSSRNAAIHEYWVFGSNGSTRHLENNEYRSDTYFNGLMALNRSQRRVFYAPFSGHTLYVRDADTQIEIASRDWFGINTSGEVYSPEAFAAGDGFAAAVASGKLMTLQSRLFADNGEQDLAVTFEPLNDAFVGEELAYRVVIRNKLAAPVIDSVASILLSTNLALARAEIAGKVVTNRSTISIELPALNAAGSITGMVTVLPLRAGLFKSSAHAAGLRRDVTPHDNSAALTTTVRIHPATDTRYDLEGDFGILAFNPKTERFISAPAPSRPVQIAQEIDPITATVTPLNLPLPPAASISISEDGSHLFALTTDLRNVLILDLATRAEVGRIALNHDGYKVTALPGTSNSFVLGTVSNLTVYDGTNSRFGTFPGFGPGATDFTVSEDGRWVHAIYQEIESWMEVSSTGLTGQGFTTVFANVNGMAKLRTQKGLLFTNHGQVGDPQRRKLIAEIGDHGWIGALVPDLDVGKIYRIHGGLEIYDAQTQRLLANHSFGNAPRSGVEIFRFGPDGILVYSTEGIILIRTPLIGSAPPADVAISIDQSLVTRGRIEYQIELRNHSTSNSAKVQALFQFPHLADLVIAPEGGTQTTNGLLLPRRTLAPGGHILEAVAIRPFATLTAPFIVRAQALTDARESITWNNWDATLTSINPLNRFEETVTFPIPAADIAGLTNGQLCVITGPEAGPGLEGRFFILDPGAGRIVGNKLFLGQRPNKIAIYWYGGTHAFVSTYPDGVIHRIDLASNTVDLRREIPGGNYIFDMAAPHPLKVLATAIPYGPNGTNYPNLFFWRDGTLSATAQGVLYLSTGPRQFGNGSAGLTGISLEGVAEKFRDFIGFTDIHAMAGYIFGENGYAHSPILQVNPLPVASLSLDPLSQDYVYALTNDNQYYTIRAYYPSNLLQHPNLAGGPIDGARFTTNLVRFGIAGLAFRTDKHIKAIRSALVPVPPGDADNDGLSNEFEWRFGLNPLLADADADLDLDGASNRQEYAAGTWPNDRESVFRLTPVWASETQLNLQFNFVQGRRYQVLRRDSFDTPWQVIREGVWPETPFPVIDIDRDGANAFYTIKALAE